MKKFQFKFETVLRVKDKKEEELKKELLKLIALKTEQEMMLNKITEERQRAGKEKVEKNSEVSNISTFIYYENYINALREQIKSTEKMIKDFENRADIK